MARKMLLMVLIGYCLCGISQTRASDPNLVLHWTFDSTTADASGSGITATRFNNPVYVDCLSDKGIQCGATDCFYNTAASALPLNAADQWTVNLWVYTPTVPTDWMVAFAIGAKPYNTAKASRALYASAGKIVFTDGGGNYLSTGVAWDVNKWQMVTVTYDGATVKVFKNAYQIGSKAFAFANALPQVRVPSNPGWGSFFTGKFDEFKVWDRALTVSEIEALIIPGAIPGYGEPSIVGWYTMDDPNSVGGVPDHSGNGYTAVYSGFTGDVADWVVDGALKFAGAQKMTVPATVSQLPVFAVSFYLKAGWEDYTSAFYQERGTDGSEFTIRGEVNYTTGKGMFKVYSKDRYWNTVFSLTVADAGSFLNLTWNHIAVVADGVDVMLYVNGQLKTTAAYVGTNNKTAMTGSVGYQSGGNGYIGSGNTAYIYDLMLWEGALSPKYLNAMLSAANFNGDLFIDEQDLKAFAASWLVDNSSGSVVTYSVDDFESYTDGASLAGTWAQYVSATYSGTGTIDITTAANSGQKALTWNYVLPETTTTTGNYTSIVYELDAASDLSGYDYASLYLNRHVGNSEEGLLFMKFIDSTNTVKAESWAYTTVNPAGQWQQWFVDFDTLKGLSGVGTVDKSVLTDIKTILIGCGKESTLARSGVIDFDDIILVSLPTCPTPVTGDVNGDCKADMLDYAVFASDWLTVN